MNFRRFLCFSADGIARKLYSDTLGRFVAPAFLQRFRLKSRGLKLWSELRAVRFVPKERLPRYANGILLDRSDSIVLDWEVPTGTLSALSKNVVHADYISLDALTSAQREQLFLMLSRYAPQEILSPEILFLQVQALCGGESNLSDYTQIWLDEFNRRFEISNYVSLPAGALCGNGRYIINMTISTKINTSTYLAAEKSGQRVVIKELVTPADSSDVVQEKQQQQFLREASILAKLNHPSIVKVRDCFVENGRSYLVMDCAQGKNMRELVHIGGVIDERTVLDVALDLVSVLQYLHEQSPPILHRDLTPDNLVFIEHSKSVMVIDFGSANVFTTGKTQTLVGKQFYMPPEQFKGQPTPESDIYAFGATLCFLACGKDMLSMAKLPPLSQYGVRSELIQLIEDCTRFDASDRPDLLQIASRLNSIKIDLKVGE
ncbi:MAG TPA: serine/threonine-protein kinase [Oculatellaceae cyanobacterium]